MSGNIWDCFPRPPRYHLRPPGTHWTLLVVRPGAYLDIPADTNTVTQLHTAHSTLGITANPGELDIVKEVFRE